VICGALDGPLPIIGVRVETNGTRSCISRVFQSFLIAILVRSVGILMGLAESSFVFTRLKWLSESSAGNPPAAFALPGNQPSGVTEYELGQIRAV
jgi:hypothetical protein